MRVGDLVEDREGDKGVVIAVDPQYGVRVSYDCTNTISGWILGASFTNLSDRVRELEWTGRRELEEKLEAMTADRDRYRAKYREQLQLRLDRAKARAACEGG